MKKLKAVELPDIPHPAILQLVSDGLWSMYEHATHMPHSAVYVLLTNRSYNPYRAEEVFFLSQTGRVLDDVWKHIRSINPLTFERPILVEVDSEVRPTLSLLSLRA